MCWHKWRVFALVALALLMGGCSSTRPKTISASSAGAVPAPRELPASPHAKSRNTASRPVSSLPTADAVAIVAASHEQPARRLVEASDVNATDPLLGEAELSLTDLEAEVLNRNQSRQAALAAWQAAAERAPQVSALDDPMFQSMFAPKSFTRSSNVQSSYYLGVAQKIPWSGKLALRGEHADAERDAMSFDFHDVELRLVEVTRVAFFDYYLVRREQEVNRKNVEQMQEFRDSAQARYESNLVTQQDVLQAEVELATLEQRRLELNRMDRVAIARINTLLHRYPTDALPPPPQTLPIRGELADAALLQQLAVENRPDLAALASRIRSEQAAWGLACKEFYPDFEIMGRFDQFWTDIEQRGQVGLNMNVPLNQRRRQAAVREALFRIAKLQASYHQQVDTIHNDVEVAHARLDESTKTVRLYQERILPAAEINVASASTEYAAGKLDFLRVIEAQREVIRLQEAYYGAIAEYHRRVAELHRAIGCAVPESAGVVEPEPAPPADGDDQ